MNSNRTMFIDAQEIIRITGMSESYAYKLIKSLNKELKDKGYVTIRGRVSRDYFEERVYGTKEMNYASLQR